MSHNAFVGANQSWTLNGLVATLRAGNATGIINLADPARGLNDLHVDDALLAGSLLGVDVELTNARTAAKEWSPADAYARGSDLVVTYREPRGEPFNLQIYWRILEMDAGDPPAIEAILSIQTPQWEAYPAVTVRSSLAGASNSSPIKGALFQQTSAINYIEATPPGDFELIDGAWRFGGHFMERGVIRRLRVRGALVTHDDGAAAAGRLQQQLATEAPPLTA